MITNSKKTMRDVLIAAITEAMQQQERIYFLSADFGAPALDRLRAQFGDRFKSVGIAEQNLINVAAGLALEGFTVFTYAIAPFIAMRAYEQIRTNLSLHAAFKSLNVNIIAVGTGLSYDVSGPTHHCLEDLTLMRALPHIELFSPSDWGLTQRFLPYCLAQNYPKYLRLDSKPVSCLYPDGVTSDFVKGFTEFLPGADLTIISTGYMTHIALQTADILGVRGIKIGVIDLFLLKNLQREALYQAIQSCAWVLTLEEGLIGCGGMDALIAEILLERQQTHTRLVRMGIRDRYVVELGGREYIHQCYGLDAVSLARTVEQLLS
jgi:transketolase